MLACKLCDDPDSADTLLTAARFDIALCCTLQHINCTLARERSAFISVNRVRDVGVRK